MDNPELDLAWRLVETTGANLFLTGKAGTGKTTFLKNLKKKSSKRMVVLAPTGIAAINAGGMTIHSFFQLPLSPYVPGATFGTDKKYFKFSKVKRNIIRTLDLLVIDEISMVRADLLDAVDSVMRRYREYDKPFGGAQLLMIGDLQQLAPVIKDDEWAMLEQFYDTPYFFSSKALRSATYKTVELSNVYRQQDTFFISILNQIRENKITDEALAALNKRYIPGFVPSDNSDYIRLTTHNYQAQSINDRELDALQSKEFVFEAEIEGSFPETSFPADKRLVLKTGAQIMFIKNDSDKRFFNGMIGEVVSLCNDRIAVRGKKDDTVFYLEKAEWTNSKYTIDNNTKEIKESVEGVFRQYPLRLAWAITIHKSQGLTFDHAIIDTSHSFAHGQTYVALSRCRTLDGIVLSEPLQREAVISDSIVDTFVNEVSKLTPAENELYDLKRDYDIKLLDELFDFQQLQSSFNLLLRTIDEHFYRKYPKLLAEYKRLGTIFSPLMDVSRKFRTQYVRLVENESQSNTMLLHERIRKASEYFSGELSGLAILCNKTKIDTDNKALKKQFEDRLATFTDELTLKMKLLKHEMDENVTFTAADYLAAKARIVLASTDLETETAKAKKSKALKPKKIPTREVTFRMFSEGMDVGQIAKERNLTVGTILSHLADCAAVGNVDISRIIPQEHIDELRQYILNNPKNNTLTEIKNAINPAISYDEIRFYLNWCKRQ